MLARVGLANRALAALNQLWCGWGAPKKTGVALDLKRLCSQPDRHSVALENQLIRERCVWGSSLHYCFLTGDRHFKLSSDAAVRFFSILAESCGVFADEFLQHSFCGCACRMEAKVGGSDSTP